MHIYFSPHIPTRSHSPQVRGTTQSLILPCPAYKLDFTSTRSRATPWGRLTWPPKLTRLMCNNARRPVHYFTTTTVNVTQARELAWRPPVVLCLLVDLDRKLNPNEKVPGDMDSGQGASLKPTFHRRRCSPFLSGSSTPVQSYAIGYSSPPPSSE